jgi:triacylglycerol esterase/lipase EstA (alpha/beta hydrolase family)
MVVANISIITKAFELSQVIQAITTLTFVKDVIIVAHSMGALDTRAYMEGLGSTYDGPCNAYPCYDPGFLKYEGDIGHVVTVDGVNAGSDLSYIAQVLFGWGSADILNVDELSPTSELVQTLNYQEAYDGVSLNPQLFLDV